MKNPHESPENTTAHFGQAVLALLVLGGLEARLVALRGVAEKVAVAFGGRRPGSVPYKI